MPGPPRMQAREAEGGWLFTGTAPFVSGWGLIDVVHAAARTDDGKLVWALLDAAETETLHVDRLHLVALNATVTVRAELADHFVPAERVTSTVPYVEGPTP